MSTSALSSEQIQQARLSDWRQLGPALHARFATGDFARGARFVAAITEVAEAANHHPDVTLTYPRVTLQLLSHDVGALTQRDVKLARAISRIADEQGVAAEPEALIHLEVGLDTADHSRLGPFWAAVLTDTAEAYAGSEVHDPAGQLPALWFQQTEPHETPKQRFHYDLWVAPETLQARLDRALAAGGQVAAVEPTFTVVADPDGNKVCFCVVTGR